MINEKTQLRIALGGTSGDVRKISVALPPSPKWEPLQRGPDEALDGEVDDSELAAEHWVSGVESLLAP